MSDWTTVEFDYEDSEYCLRYHVSASVQVTPGDRITPGMTCVEIDEVTPDIVCPANAEIGTIMEEIKEKAMEVFYANRSDPRRY